MFGLSQINNSFLTSNATVVDGMTLYNFKFRFGLPSSAYWTGFILLNGSNMSKSGTKRVKITVFSGSRLYFLCLYQQIEFENLYYLYFFIWPQTLIFSNCDANFYSIFGLRSKLDIYLTLCIRTVQIAPLNRF